MLCFSSTLLLAATCLLVTAVESSYIVTTCEGNHVHRLSCDSGVISIQTTLYGRKDTVTCSEGQTAQQLSNTECSLSNARDVLKNRCDGKTVCELTPPDLGAPDLCGGTYKYLQTEYICLPAIRQVTCEDSMAHLQCGGGEVIFVYGAYYGRVDPSTCSYKRPAGQTADVDCSQPATKVSESCNGKNSCMIKASNSVFGDPCEGTYKYLEVAYVCEYPVSSPKNTEDSLDMQ
ncbi:L-rhamnose-binding lectin SML-like [Notolabrus celidotus]|uniref:L-rhamnose-binding lectin SML-like n=1 Tax=Notolabrus celidotus TaxID=1203425 RepID=UPI00149073E6|nr:L-rhamnose-binding lectin SML-like [Notolabrus celidotus]